jgi:hypothetical protein
VLNIDRVRSILADWHNPLFRPIALMQHHDLIRHRPVIDNLVAAWIELARTPDSADQGDVVTVVEEGHVRFDDCQLGERGVPGCGSGAEVLGLVGPRPGVTGVFNNN